MTLLKRSGTLRGRVILNEVTSQNLKDFVDSLEEEWKAQVPTLSTEPIAVVARLVRMSYYVERRVAENLARYDLTRGEFEVLAVLTRNPDMVITPKILQTKILITSGGLSNRRKRPFGTFPGYQ